jgi:hypothetical protein
MKIRNFEIQEKGSALILALFFVMILTVIGLSLMFNTSVDNVISNNYAKTVRATYSATSGVERFKAYLLYDFKHDPGQWSNRYLVVPPGSRYLDPITLSYPPSGALAPSAVAIGGSGSDAYFDMEPTGSPNTAPSSNPWKINPLIPYVADAALYAQINSWVTPGGTGQVVVPGSGYQLMIRNVPSALGGTCTPSSDTAPSNCSADSIYIMSIGRTTTTKAYLNSESRGMNLIEAGIFGDDISVWNNIFFAVSNDFTGGGAMTIHGNVHTLGPNPPPNVNTTVFDTAANVLNTYYMTTNSQGRLEDPLRSMLSTPQQRFPSNIADVRNSLSAKFRVRNGVANLQGSSYVGTAAIPFVEIATCRSCGSYGNGFTEANPDIHAQRIKNYVVPTGLQNLIKVPNVNDPYKDPATNINYPKYTDYFIGMESFPYVNNGSFPGVGAQGFNYPGAMALKLATALQSNSNMIFDNSTGVNSLSYQVWLHKNEIFAQNVENTGSPGSAHEQRPLDPLDSEIGGLTTDALFNPVIGSGYSGGTYTGDGKTYMIVAVDEIQNVVVIYKEVNPFTRAIDNNPQDGLGATTNVDFPRVVHGFVFAPFGANMAALQLKVDIDGNNIDGGLDWIYSNTIPVGECTTGPPSCNGTLSTVDSNRLVRRVVDSLWKASRGDCGVAGPCYSSLTIAGPANNPPARSPNDFWEPSLADYTQNFSRIYDTASPSPYYLKVLPTAPEDTGGNPGNGRKGKLIGFGAIETTDNVIIGDNSGGSSNGIVFAGRFTLFARDSDNSGVGTARGLISFEDNMYSVSSYQWPVVGKYIAFPCQNNLGIMTTYDIDQSISPHDEFGGAFYAAGVIHLTRQEQILGAMVSSSWDFAGGGNPDFYQAMEISRCLPPYIVAKDPIVFAEGQSWIER